VIHNRIALPLLLVSMLVGMSTLNGCGASQESGTTERDVTEVSTEVSTSTNQVDHIVFVGLKESCDCTRNRIDESWRVLQHSLATVPDIGVQRIQRDVHREDALQLHRLKPLMVAPGLYFLDAEDQLIELLQGEISEQQLSALLQSASD
jgi:hypothetical protein